MLECEVHDHHRFKAQARSAVFRPSNASAIASPAIAPSKATSAAPSRLAYTELFADERENSAVAFTGLAIDGSLGTACSSSASCRVLPKEECRPMGMTYRCDLFASYVSTHSSA